eukprot:1553252-Ditylum_brightwellii.AAC.1
MAITVRIWEKLGRAHNDHPYLNNSVMQRCSVYYKTKTCADISLLHCLALFCCPWLTPWKTNCAISKNKGAKDSMAVSQGALTSRPSHDDITETGGRGSPHVTVHVKSTGNSLEVQFTGA